MSIEDFELMRTCSPPILGPVDKGMDAMTGAVSEFVPQSDAELCWIDRLLSCEMG
jgi:hypothetical protein